MVKWSYGYGHFLGVGIIGWVATDIPTVLASRALMVLYGTLLCSLLGLLSH